MYLEDTSKIMIFNGLSLFYILILLLIKYLIQFLTNHCYYNKSKTIDNQFDFLNASLAYQKKDSKWEYRLSATNLLNTKTRNSDFFNQFSIVTSQYWIQPRYVIFTLKYNL